MEVKKRKSKDVLAEMVANIDEESLAKTREEMMEQAKHPILYTREMGRDARNKIDLDRIFGETATVIWRDSFAGSNSIGNCDELCQLIVGAFMDNYGKMPTDQEYLDAQIEYAESRKDDFKVNSRGLTENEWWRLAERYRNAIKKQEPTFPYGVEDCLYAAIYHAVSQTMDGKRAEKELIDNLILGKTHKDVEYPSGADDALYGIDFFAYFGSPNKKYGVQVKPISFYKGKKLDGKKDIENLVEKYFAANEHFGLVGMLYAIYETRRDNTNEWFYKEVNGRKKFLFTIDELYDVDTKTLNCFVGGKMKYKKCAF